MYTVRALINPEQCIGCLRCIKACPVDAIIGAPKKLHQVIESYCTGCEDCLSVCPVDCIELIDVNYSHAEKTIRETISETRAKYNAKTPPALSPQNNSKNIITDLAQILARAKIKLNNKNNII